ncbi:hypothetical protein SAMN06295910_0532 [Allosphingosinicella indica]|uniref:Transporter substrate-binding domain-containing protein n=2 Tax=Allosphingosinicella indica TaxID=941907 RepID=A0A1X7FZL6_9SPHN|nr:hypothetical protein SAMN06295910_0532 [Allosphingosinicella indica]
MRCGAVMRRSLLPLLLALAGCGAIPADPDGTLERVRSEQAFRVGIIAGTDSVRFAVPTGAFLAGVDRATGARARIESGPSETLLAKLEAGALDLVVGEVAHDSPWAKRVSILRPIAEHHGPQHRAVLTPIARHGENAWIMVLDREARAVRSGEL